MRIGEWLLRFLRTIWENLDLLAVLVTALVIGALDLLNVDGVQATGAILPVLAVLAFAWLRDRHRNTEAAARVESVKGATDDIRNLLTAGGGGRTLVGTEIGNALQEARQDTDRWMFKGGTGTYTRAVTLPECVAAAQRARRPLEFKLEILDPADAHLCARYTRLHQELAPGNAEEQEWTPKDTRKDLYATILACAWYHQRSQQLLDLEVRLSPTMTLFRWDLSGSRLIITQRGPSFPAVQFDKESPHYNLWRIELRTSLIQARRVPLENGTPLSERPTIEETKDLFVSLGLPLPDNFTEADIRQIPRNALNHIDPYRGQTARPAPLPISEPA
ncbi:hypothetical protein [Nonomuraea sediminis]|uniref:hypothetical protein n=1 Tax=Nonomuraea sediminis TaxID=2835864 RepID=UPI001BDC1FAB|nr:hypothetical protein [Nonomuraea sediminis]